MSEEFKTALNELINACDHGIPYYAYGDNEAAIELSTRLSYCKKMAEKIAEIIVEEK